MVHKTKTGCNYMLSNFNHVQGEMGDLLAINNSKSTTRNSVQERCQNLGGKQRSIHKHVSKQRRGHGKSWNQTGPRRFQNTTLLCCSQQLRVSSPFTGRRASPGNQPQNRKGYGAPIRVHKGKVITEKTLLQYEERLADDKTVDCLEYLAIVASAI